MSNSVSMDERTLVGAKMLHGRLTLGDFPGGDVQKISTIQVFLNDFLKDAAFADWSDPDHIMARLRAYSEIEAEDAPKAALVNEFKAAEERLLRQIEVIPTGDARGDVNPLLPQCDGRWLAIARTHIQEGFDAIERAIVQRPRIKLPEDT